MTNEQKQKQKDERLMRRAMAAVCTAFEIDGVQLQARDRHRNVADARMSLCTLLTEQALRSDTIAAFIKRNRSNVAHSNRTIRALENRDKALTEKLNRARRLLNAPDYTEQAFKAANSEIVWEDGDNNFVVEREWVVDGVVNCVGFDVETHLNVETDCDNGGYYCSYSSGYARVEYFDLTAHLEGDPDAECDPTIAIDVDWLEEMINNEI